jgi:hypothetical protein
VLSFGYFSLHKQRKVTGMSGHPDDLELKTQKTNLTAPLTQQDVKITCANAHNSSSPSSKNRF